MSVRTTSITTVRQLTITAWSDYLHTSMDSLPGDWSQHLAVAAFGSFARGDMTSCSDIDLVFLVDSHNTQLQETIVQHVLYPLWDNGHEVDYSFRTITECIQLATDDLTVALSLVDIRHITGNDTLTTGLQQETSRLWRQHISQWLPLISQQARTRHTRSGVVADLMQPDIKNGLGGVRDYHALKVLAVSQLALSSPLPADPQGREKLEQAYNFLTDCRFALHALSGKRRDIVLAHYGDDIAAMLHLTDRFQLIREISTAGRLISYAWQNAADHAAQSLLARTTRSPQALARARRPAGRDVVIADERIVLAHAASPTQDPYLPLKVACAAATHNLPIAQSTMRRLTQCHPGLPEHPTPYLLELLVDFLSRGLPIIPVVETLDRGGIWSTFIPQWEHIRDLPSTEISHIYVCDRHLLHTVAQTRQLLTNVSRPDLLLLSALLHDLGKGRREDHSEVGAKIAAQLLPRLGATPQDTTRVVAAVRLHLYLPKLINTMDVSSPDTWAEVHHTVGEDPVLCEILLALMRADSLATGPNVWSVNKETLSTQLARGYFSHYPLLTQAGHHGPARDTPGITMTPHGDTFAISLTQPDSWEHISSLLATLRTHSLATHRAHLTFADKLCTLTGEFSTAFGAPPAAALIRQDINRLATTCLDTPQPRAHSYDYSLSTGYLTSSEDSTHTFVPVTTRRHFGMIHHHTQHQREATHLLLRYSAQDSEYVGERLIALCGEHSLRPEWIHMRRCGSVLSYSVCVHADDDLLPGQATYQLVWEQLGQLCSLSDGSEDESTTANS